MAKALYIHIPFCDQICSYCDFPKVFSKGQDKDAYIDSLLLELDLYKKKVGFDDLKTIYFGGGTPTVLTSAQFDRIFGYLHDAIIFDNIIEVSVEANPESLNDDDKIECLKRNGVTRISIGVQTFNERLLKVLQRSHKKEDVVNVVEKLSKSGFEINIDMIYSIPSQTLSDWETDLDELLKLPVTHVSAYSLILEEHTRFYLDYMKDKIELVDNDVEAQMFDGVIKRLVGAGFEHYEISNFTRGKRSFHNETYWKNEYYIGVGLGSHGHYRHKGSSIRYANTRSITAYKKALENGELPVLESRALSKYERIEEAMFLGLRMLGGIDVGKLSKRHDEDIYLLYKDKINKLVEVGLVNYQDDILRLTGKGLMLANEVFGEMLI